MKSIKKIAFEIDSWGADFGLVFDKKKIQENAQALVEQFNHFDLHFSVKSFPDPTFLKTLAPIIHGWDICNAQELDLIKDIILAHQTLWLTNSSEEVARAALGIGKKLSFTLDHTTGFDLSLPEVVDFGLRLDPFSLLGKGHSRYGLLLSELDLIPQSLKDKIVYLHTHHPGATSARDLFRLREAIERLIPFFPKLKYINLGGGLCEENFDAYLILQDTFPGPQIHIEPGRWFSEPGGFAFSRINSYFMKNDDLYLVGNLSHAAHLRWSQGIDYTFIPQSTSKSYQYKRLIYSSSNALESDQFILKNSPGILKIGENDWIVFGNISGYAAAWNHSFNGSGVAPIFFLD